MEVFTCKQDRMHNIEQDHQSRSELTVALTTYCLNLSRNQMPKF